MTELEEYVEKENEELKATISKMEKDEAELKEKYADLLFQADTVKECYQKIEKENERLKKALQDVLDVLNNFV